MNKIILRKPDNSVKASPLVSHQEASPLEPSKEKILNLIEQLKAMPGVLHVEVTTEDDLEEMHQKLCTGGCHDFDRAY